MSIRPILEQILDLKREELALSPRQLKLVWFGETEWAIEFKGNRFAPTLPFNPSVFISSIIKGEEKTIIDKLKESDKEEDKQRDVKLVKAEKARIKAEKEAKEKEDAELKEKLEKEEAKKLKINDKKEKLGVKKLKKKIKK